MAFLWLFAYYRYQGIEKYTYKGNGLPCNFTIVMKKIVVENKGALRRRYRLRRTGRRWLSWETTIPREVIEREARRLGIPLTEFEKRFEVEWLFDNFAGLHLVLVPKGGS